MWTLYICTAGWIMCGQAISADYPTETQCYKALDELYKRQGKDDFKYVTCSPKGAIKKEIPK